MTVSKTLAMQFAARRRDQADSDRVEAETLGLYDRDSLALRRYLLFTGVERETAADIVQETFLKLYQHLLAGGARDNLRAWLYRVAHNLARNAQLSHRVSKTGSLSDVQEDDRLTDPKASVEEVLLAREADEQLKRAVDRLSTAQRECLVLRSQGLKYREIAMALELSTSTVAENVQRGLENLRAGLESLEGPKSEGKI